MRDVVESIVPGQLSLLIGLWCLYVIAQGRQDWAAGAYVASAYAARSIMIGPFAHTWVFLGTLLGAAIVRALRRERYYALPPTDRWIVVWLAVWWVWILVLLWQFDPEVKASILRYLTLYIIAPLPAVLQISRDRSQIRGFALAFVVGVLGSAALALYGAAGSFSVSSVLAAGVVGYFGIANYHAFSYGLGIGLILTVALFRTSAGILFRSTWLAVTMLLGVLIFLAGSRQSMLGVGMVLLLLIGQALIARGAQVVPVLVVASAIALVGAGLYALLPEQISRVQPELGATGIYGAYAERTELWGRGIQDFLDSPLWGWGFNRFWAHNLFIGGLADQGLTGAVFLVGFLWFLGRRIREGLIASRRGADSSWFVAFAGVAMFGMVHSQISGSPVSVWHLYWSAAFMWGMQVRWSPPVERTAA